MPVRVESIELGLELLRGLIACRWLRLDALRDDAIDRLGNRRIDRTKAGRRLSRPFDEERQGGVALRRTALPDEHLRDDQAERVDVGALIDRLSHGLFGGHVRERADDRTGRGRQRAGFGRSGDAEVRDSRCAFSTSSIRMFAGLRSRWTMPASCAARSPDTIWRRQRERARRRAACPARAARQVGARRRTAW